MEFILIYPLTMTFIKNKSNKRLLRIAIVKMKLSKSV